VLFKKIDTSDLQISRKEISTMAINHLIDRAPASLASAEARPKPASAQVSEDYVTRLCLHHQGQGTFTITCTVRIHKLERDST
jgi:hypothetical protein